MPETLSAEHRVAIANLIYDYFRFIDHGEAARVADLFDHPARLTFGPGAPSPGTIEGDAIPQAMRDRQKLSVTTRHFVSNIRLEPQNDGSVKAYSLLLLYRGSDGTPSIADIQDQLVKTRGGWKIKSRVISPVSFTA